jgi:hypothetical protein
MMAAGKPSSAAPDIQIPGMAGFLGTWIKEVQMAGVKPPNRAKLYATEKPLPLKPLFAVYPSGGYRWYPRQQSISFSTLRS